MIDSTRDLHASIAARQEIDPANRDDAEYIVGHPRDFSPEMVAEATRTTDDAAPHDCWDEAVPYESDGALGHGWECGRCGKFLQAG